MVRRLGAPPTHVWLPHAQYALLIRNDPAQQQLNGSAALWACPPQMGCASRTIHQGMTPGRRKWQLVDAFIFPSSSLLCSLCLVFLNLFILFIMRYDDIPTPRLICLLLHPMFPLTQGCPCCTQLRIPRYRACHWSIFERYFLWQHFALRARQKTYLLKTWHCKPPSCTPGHLQVGKWVEISSVCLTRIRMLFI